MRRKHSADIKDFFDAFEEKDNWLLVLILFMRAAGEEPEEFAETVH